MKYNGYEPYFTWLIAIYFLYGSLPYHLPMSTTRTPQDADKYIVRFPAGMRELIANEAEANGRSMNAEIVQRLSATFAVDGDVAALARQVEALTAQRDDAYRAIRAMQGTQEALAQLTIAVADHASRAKDANAQSTIAAARAVAAGLLAPLPAADEVAAIAPVKRRRSSASAK